MQDHSSLQPARILAPRTSRRCVSLDPRASFSACLLVTGAIPHISRRIPSINYRPGFIVVDRT